MYVEDTNGSFFEVVSIALLRSGTQLTYRPALAGEQTTVAIPDEAIVPNQDTETAVLNWMTGNDGLWPGGSFMEEAEYLLRSAKATKHFEVRGRKAAIEAAGLPTSFGVVDSDLDSRSKISGAAQMADFSLNPNYAAFFADPVTGDPVSFSIDWRLADDSHVTLSAIDMIQMGLEVGNTVSHIQAVKDHFDAAIDAAVTVEEVEAIDVYVDWLSFNPS